MMKLSTAVAVTSALLVCACSKADEAPATAEAEVAPVPVEAPATSEPAAYSLPPEAAAFVAALSPMELGQARLSCVEPLRTAKSYPSIWSGEMAAELASVEDFSRTKLLTSEPLNTLTQDQARTIMDLGPKFNGHSKPTEDEIKGVSQCIMLARHYAAEQAGN